MADVIQLITQESAAGTMQPLPMVLLAVALLWFLLCGIVLFVIDVQEHRLPNSWTALLFSGAAVLLVAGTLTAGQDSVLAGRCLMTLIGSASYLAIMFILHVITRAGVGMGDVKLAAGLGLYTGFIGVEALIAGFVLAFVIGGIHALFLVVFRGAKKTTRIAFGPAMLIAATACMLM